MGAALTAVNVNGGCLVVFQPVTINFRGMASIQQVRIFLGRKSEPGGSMAALASSKVNIEGSQIFPHMVGCARREDGDHDAAAASPRSAPLDWR